MLFKDICTKKLQIIMLLLLTATYDCYTQNTKADSEKEKRREEVKKGVIRITADKGYDVIDVGAGIMIGQQMNYIYILTAYHVVEDAKTIWVETYGNRGNKIEAKIFDDRYDPDFDLVVLVVPSIKFSENSCLQLYEKNVEEMNPGDPLTILGHPPDQEWEISKTTLIAKDNNYINFEKGVIEPSYSGGPLMDNYGNLLGMILCKDIKSQGKAVRIDVAFKILDKWNTPYKIKHVVNFCEIINQLIIDSFADFDPLKGAAYRNNNTTIWPLLDQNMDITGYAKTQIVNNFRNEKDTYYADFGKQQNDREGIRAMSNLADKIQGCLPTGHGRNPIHEESEYCFYLAFRRRENWLQDPIMFVIHRTYGNKVELIVYRGYNIPYGMNLGNDFHYSTPIR